MPGPKSADRCWCRASEDGSLILHLHAQPGARRTEIAGVHGEGAEQRLKIRIAAPAVEGKANAALRAFLAKAFGVGLRNVDLRRGETGRAKTVHITAPARRPDADWP